MTKNKSTSETVKQWIINIAVLIVVPLFLGTAIWNILDPETFWNRLVALILGGIVVVAYIFVLKLSLEYLEEQGQHERLTAVTLTPGTRGFHWKNGWFFEREQGFMDVRIKIFENAKPGAPLKMSVEISAHEWCSIIASMSEEGETSKKWIEAKKFHGIRDVDTEAML